MSVIEVFRQLSRYGIRKARKAIGGMSTVGVVVADFNGDGNPDLAVLDAGSNDAIDQV